MSYQNFIRRKTPVNNSFERTDGSYILSKKRQNFFRENPNYTKNLCSLSRNPYVPFDFYNNQVDKNAYQVHYKDEAQKNLFPNLPKEEILDNKTKMYPNLKNRSFSRTQNQLIPRNLSQNENLRNNRNYSIPKLINTNNQKRYNSFYGNKSNIFKNIKNIRFYTPEPLRVTKNGKIIYKLKRVFNDGNYNYNEYNNFNDDLRYGDSNYDDQFERIKFSSTDSKFFPRIDRKFHKSQIFNLYKPFLVDQFQEYRKIE